MKERKIRGRSRRRKYKNQMRRPIAVLLALMLSFSSFGTATAYADDAAVVKESVDTAGTQEKVDLDKWMEKEVFDTGKQAENIAGKDTVGVQDGSTVADVSGDEGSDGAGEGNEAGTVGSVNENGNSQTGEENGQNPSGEQTDNPYDSIERPSQSDTVEIIPGAPSDSKKNESDANSGTGSAGSASGAAGDSNSQNGQENVDNSGNQTGGSQETEVKPVLPEEKDYEYFYDKRNWKI